ncbi:hypothetical protein DQ244_08500 [Blastococcus sp. TBT05-19]|uniref:hypothetical protein n=1 Tax=Blastococcus sp. TBT05-19 TaxID=2250581 RepID=UPI000DEA0966|nr:hypothetical protein [Blastococcus sp. TBT05-19]RBY92306.1 hypothetical protein DQ244_08500 [Blastococcus sp. TBT05-19]
MNELTLLREAGPQAPELTPAARSAARAALLAEIEGPAPRRSRRPSRKVAFRLGVALATAAAAWTGAVLIAAPDGPGTPAESVTLVDFAMPTFPLSLDPVPDGLRPAFDGNGDGASIASFDDAAGENGFTVYVGEDEPEGNGPDDGAPGHELLDVDEIPLGDDDVEAVTYARDWCVEDTATGCLTERRRFTWLSWERRDDQWVSLLGHGDYADAEQLQAVAGSLVDRPQPATLEMGLAPAGWSVQFFTMGRVLTLVNDAYEQQTLTVHVPLSEDVIPLEQLPTGIEAPAGPAVPVTVHGLPARVVPTDHGPGMGGWYLQASFADGTTFTVQAPDAFTQEQVVELAEQVTHNR